MNFRWNTCSSSISEADRRRRCRPGAPTSSLLRLRRRSRRCSTSGFTAASSAPRRPLSWKPSASGFATTFGSPQFAAAGPGRASGGTGLGGPAAAAPIVRSCSTDVVPGRMRWPLCAGARTRAPKPRRGALGFPDPAGSAGAAAAILPSRSPLFRPVRIRAPPAIQSVWHRAARLLRSAAEMTYRSGGVRGRGSPPFASLIGAWNVQDLTTAPGVANGRALCALVARAAAHCPCHRGLSAGVSRAGPDGRRSRDGARGVGTAAAARHPRQLRDQPAALSPPPGG